MSLDLSFERVIDASPEEVFDAFTRPDGQVAFYGQDDPSWIVESECDLRVGGAWTVDFGAARDALWRHEHVFTAIDPPHRLTLRTTEIRLDGSVLKTEMEFRFEPHDGGTLMTLVHRGFPTAELREEHTRGLPNAFARFERVASGR